MSQTTHINQALSFFKQDIIGIVKNKDSIEFLLDYQECEKGISYIKTAFISKFLAIHSYNGTLLPNQTVILFPDNKSMYDMIENPFEWNKFCKEHNL